MTYQEVIALIDRKAISLEKEDDDEMGMWLIQDATEAIIQYTLDKGLDYKVGNWMLSFIFNADDDEIEEFDGCRTPLLENFLEMAIGSSTLIDDYPLPGQYKHIKDIDPEIPALINYMHRKFWPDYFEDLEES